VHLSKLNTSVGATKPEELKHDAGARTHEARLVRRKPEVQSTPHDGSRQRRSADKRKRGTTFHLTEPSAGEAQRLTHGRGRKAEVDMGLVDRAHVRLKRTSVHLVLLLQKAQIEQDRRLRGWHGAEGLVPELHLNFGAEAEEAIELALVRGGSPRATPMSQKLSGCGGAWSSHVNAMKRAGDEGRGPGLLSE
jgi:hypothetical protein